MSTEHVIYCWLCIQRYPLSGYFVCVRFHSSDTPACAWGNHVGVGLLFVHSCGHSRREHAKSMYTCVPNIFRGSVKDKEIVTVKLVSWCLENTGTMLPNLYARLNKQKLKKKKKKKKNCMGVLFGPLFLLSSQKTGPRIETQNKYYKQGVNGTRARCKVWKSTPFPEYTRVDSGLPRFYPRVVSRLYPRVDSGGTQNLSVPPRIYPFGGIVWNLPP